MPATPRNLVPFVHVVDVETSVAFYQRLGFTLRNTQPPAGEGRAIWAWMTGDRGDLMLGQSNGPIDAGQQTVMFYLYFDDIEAVHAQFAAEGLDVGPMRYPFYCPKGEFRMQDPDGYVLMLTHA